MRDTIYRDDAIRVASGYCHPANVAQELAKLPSAQPERKKEELVRCSDCGFRIKSECNRVGQTVKPNDYCSYAERRTDEQTV